MHSGDLPPPGMRLETTSDDYLQPELRQIEGIKSPIYEMKNHTYFITGGLGFLGQYIVKAIHEHDPLGKIHLQFRTPRRTFLNVRSIPNVQLISADLRNPEDFSMQLEGVDTVIHNAALVSLKRGDEDALYESNIEGTKNVLRAALAHGCQNFVFISSISAIGREPGRLSDETMIPAENEKKRTDPYGYSKLIGEKALQAEKGRIRVIILNPSVILGPGSQRIERVVRWLKWLPICPMFTTLNSFVDVRDTAKAVVLALTEGRSGERYIVTTKNVEMLAFAQMVLDAQDHNAAVFPAPKGLITLGDWIVRLLDICKLNPGLKNFSATHVDKAYSAEKIRREMGWEPDYSLEQTLRDTLSNSPR